MHKRNGHAVQFALFIAILASLLLSGCGQGEGRARVVEPLVDKTSMSKSMSFAALTPLVPIKGPAVLGARIGAFVYKFGYPDRDSDPSFDSYEFKRYSATETDYLHVMGDRNDGRQWMPYIYLIELTAPPHQPWASSAANTLCSSFLPPDARYVSQSPAIAKQGTIEGINIVYYSAMLKAALPASQFYDAQHKPVKSGLLDIYYSLAGGSQDKIDYCTLVPGILI